jgi:hypothetical protein
MVRVSGVRFFGVRVSGNRCLFFLKLVRILATGVEGLGFRV